MIRPKYWTIACIGAGLIALTTTSTRADSKGVAAVVGGQKITTAELDGRLLKTNMKLAQSLYNARRVMLDDLIMEQILKPEAKAKGVTVKELFADRLAAKIVPVTDAAVKKFFDDNKARIGGRTLEQVGGQIRAMLVRQGDSTARVALLAELKKNADVKIVLDPPRADVAVSANDPMKGPKDAKVTIVEFSDFQ